jgi:hypothetical protein
MVCSGTSSACYVLDFTSGHFDIVVIETLVLLLLCVAFQRLRKRLIVFPGIHIAKNYLLTNLRIRCAFCVFDYSVSILGAK